MSGIRTAESRYIGENADVVPDKAVSPALDQQNCGLRSVSFFSKADHFVSRGYYRRGRKTGQENGVEKTFKKMKIMLAINIME